MNLDLRWQAMKLLSLFVKSPGLFTINIGESVHDEESGHSLLADSLVPGTDIQFQACEASMPFEGCDHYRVEFAGNSIEIGVLDDQVESVFYDSEWHRESGPKRVRKLRQLLSDHSEADPLHELTDNGSAVLYSSTNKTQFAAYGYLADTFLIYSTSVKPIRKRSRTSD